MTLDVNVHSVLDRPRGEASFIGRLKVRWIAGRVIDAPLNSGALRIVLVHFCKAGSLLQIRQSSQQESQPSLLAEGFCMSS